MDVMIGLFSKYINNHGDSDLAARLAQFSGQVISVQFAEARQTAYEICEIPKYNPIGIYAVGLVAYLRGDFKSAKNSWNILQQSGHRSPLVLLSNGMVDLKLGKAGEIPELVSHVKSRFPEFFEIAILEALHARAIGNYSQAKEVIERLLNEAVLSDDDARELGALYSDVISRLGFHEDAIALCNEIVASSDAIRSDVVRVLLESYAATEQRDAAIDLLANISLDVLSLDDAPRAASALVTLGLHKVVISFLELCLERDPANTDLLSVQVVALSESGGDARPSRKRLDLILFKKKKGIPFFISDDFVECYRPFHALTLVNWDGCHTLYHALHHIVRNQVEGDIVECGVFRGGVSAFMAHVLVRNKSVFRKLYMCDTYEGMTVPDDNDLLGADTTKTSSAVNLYFPGLAKIDENSVLKLVRETGYPDNNVVIVKGPVEETLPQNAPQKICILRLDTDWYKSTLHELETMMPRVAKHGIVIVDDYASWDGSRKAFHEYAERHSLRYFPTVDIVQGSLTFVKME